MIRSHSGRKSSRMSLDELRKLSDGGPSAEVASRKQSARKSLEELRAISKPSLDDFLQRKDSSGELIFEHRKAGEGECLFNKKSGISYWLKQGTREVSGLEGHHPQ